MAGDFGRRAPVHGSGDEIDQVAMRMNSMLDRIQVLMEGMEQVSNDIAHDLRTPISRLRQRLESAHMHASSEADYRRAIELAIADTNAIIQTFSALLRIAQIEAGASRRELASVDLSELCMSISATYLAVVEGNGQSFATEIEPNIMVDGDRNLLTQMIANLIENATRHSPGGTRIAVQLKSRGVKAVLSIADTGPGIPVDERSKVVRRFYRLERSRTTPGSGLGLALVKAVCEFHHAEVAFSDNAPGLCVSIGFGACMSDAPSGKRLNRLLD